MFMLTQVAEATSDASNSLSFESILTILIAIIAIASPVLTALINNSHQREMFKLETAQKANVDNNLHIRNVYEQYLKFLGEYVSFKLTPGVSLSTVQNYNRYYFNTLFYVSEATANVIKSIDNCLASEDYTNAIKLSVEVSELLKQEITNMQSKTK